YKIPGGGMLSTAEDLVRLGAAVMAPGELNETEIELLHTSSQLSSGRDVGYSLGWSVGGGDVPSRISHTGSQPGSHCLLYARPRQEIVVAVLCNSRGAPFGATLAEIITDHFEAGNGEGPAIDPTGVYEIVPAEGDPVRVDVWRQADHYRAMVTFGAERMPLMSVQVVENRIVAHAFDGRLVELEMTLTGDEVEAVLRRGGTTRASGRRVSSEAFSVRGDH
ncbi:MAG: serine hydrolase, partial [Phycisphaerales bacterium]